MQNIALFLWTIGAFIIAIGLLVTVHELGHFAVARSCGVKVLNFSIGFGPKLWRCTDKTGTEYAIGLLPLGGYVRMLNSKVDQLDSTSCYAAFDQQSAVRRAAIISAGPIANFLLAVLLYTISYLWGVPTTAPVVANVVTGSVIAEAGLPSNSQIEAINGVVTANWPAVRQQLKHLPIGATTKIEYRPLTSTKSSLLTLQVPVGSSDNRLLALGIVPYTINSQAKVAAITPHSAAALAQIAVGDTLLAINDNPIESWEKFTQFVRQHPNESVNLRLQHVGEVKQIRLVLGSRVEQGQTVGFLGIVPQIDFAKLPVVKYNFIDSLTTALKNTGSFVKLGVQSLYKLLIGDFHLGQLAGPVSIAKGAAQSAHQGIVPYLFYLGFISISVGVINLIPLPILDGGQLLFILIEKLKGSPLSERVQEISFRVGASLLLLMIAFALFNDFSHLL